MVRIIPEVIGRGPKTSWKGGYHGRYWYPQCTRLCNMKNEYVGLWFERRRRCTMAPSNSTRRYPNSEGGHSDWRLTTADRQCSWRLWCPNDRKLWPRNDTSGNGYSPISELGEKWWRWNSSDSREDPLGRQNRCPDDTSPWFAWDEYGKCFV